MEILKSFYSNFFTAGALIPTFFHLYLAFLFLKTIRDKSKPSFHLGMAYFYLFLFNFAYFFAGSFYHHIAVFHRWLTVGVILLLETHFNMFMYHLHEEKNTKFSKILLIVQYAIAIVTSIIFFIKTFSADKVYHFAGHYWDFDADTISKIIGIFIFLYIIFFIIIMIWKVITVKEKERWIILLMGISYILASLVPSITNILSRDGALDRGTFQVTWDLFNILGFFLLAVLYINYTKDKTTFMAKIVGISLVTMLVVLQGLGYYSFQDQEDAYDAIHRSYSNHAVDSQFRSPDMKFLVEYTPGEDKYTGVFYQDEKFKQIKFNTEKEKYLNTTLWEKIRNSSSREEVRVVLNQNHSYFYGYNNTIRDFMKISPRHGKELTRQILSYIVSLKRTIIVKKNKIIKIPVEKFREQISKQVQKAGKKLEHFNKAILKHLSESSSGNEKLKQEILRYFTTMSPPGERHYIKHGNNHYISYLIYKNNKIFNVGYSYIKYREYLHGSAVKLIFMLLSVFFVVLIGFRFFFFGALMHPLNQLLQGLQEIRKGNLEIEIPVKVEDEIGMLTHNFNSMAKTIFNAKKRLDNNAVYLEEEVNKRTAELKQATNALWGEMQLAKKIQTVLLPEKPIMKSYEIACFMEPADEVGGDYYDIINFKDVDWVLIGDVSGHGVSAGIIMMMVQTAIQAILRGNPNLKPSMLLKVVNKAISYNINRLDEDKYMTITAFSFNKDGTILYSGLHQDILIFRSETGLVESMETNGLWLGISMDLGRTITDYKFNVNEGDVVLLYTDGITEAMNSEGIMYGNERLEEIFQKNGNLSPVKIKEAILNDLNGYTNNDDLTMVVLKCVKF